MFIPGEKSVFKPTLSPLSLLLFALSGTLGGGIFVLIGKAGKLAGYFLPFSFLISGIIAFLISRIYAELSSSIPTTGGSFTYIKNAFGSNYFLFLVYWILWLAQLGYSSLNALGAGIYLSLIFPFPPLLIALTIILIFLIISFLGTKKMQKLQIIIGIIVLISLLILCESLFKTFSFKIEAPENYLSFKNLLGLLWVLPLTFIIFIGNENITTFSPYVKNPSKNLPLVLSLNVLILTAFTILFSFLMINSFPSKELFNTLEPFFLFKKYLGSKIGLLALISAILACISSLFFCIITASHSAYALGKMGEFPQIFSKLNAKKSPVLSTTISGILVIILCLFQNPELCARLTNIGFFMQYIVVSLSLIKLRKTRPYLPRPYLVKPFPLIPYLLIFFSLIFLLFSGIKAWILTIIFSLIGTFVYFFRYLTKERGILVFLGIILFLVLTLSIFSILYFLSLHY